MKRKLKRFLGILFSFALMLTMMQGLSLTAFADGSGAYNEYLVTADANKGKSGDALAALQVYFNGLPWYIIEDKSTAADAGTVALLAADESFGLSTFSDVDSHIYKTSKVKGYLDALTTTGSFKDVADVIVETDNGLLYLLSANEARAIKSANPEALRMKFDVALEEGEDRLNAWWLREPTSDGSRVPVTIKKLLTKCEYNINNTPA